MTQLRLQLVTTREALQIARNTEMLLRQELDRVRHVLKAMKREQEAMRVMEKLHQIEVTPTDRELTDYGDNL